MLPNRTQISRSVTIQATDGGSFSGYMALPAQVPAPAIIVIQEIFGVNAELRAKCDELARQGYVAIAPDLFWRIEPGIDLVDSIPDQLQRAFDLFGLFDVAKGMADLKATLAFLRQRPECSGSVGCIGFCLGGKLAYMMAAQTDVDASVSYYGVGIEAMLGDAARIQTPLLMHIAAEDKFVSKEAQAQIVAAFKDSPLVATHVYPGADHAFARGHGTAQPGMHYDATAAHLAQERTAAFLQKALR
ncbi:MAG: dienelactone hydrolase family protein [Alphaproteobacteria bacterium]|nr:dienelactone hydrolase family protein [Alphaproteobacteria bacterium]